MSDLIYFFLILRSDKSVYLPTEPDADESSATAEESTILDKIKAEWLKADEDLNAPDADD